MKEHLNIYNLCNHYDQIIFDCDGVLIDSNNIKTNGFKILFSKHKHEQVNHLIEYHKKNNGISRYNKIKYFYNKILKKISKELIMKLSSEFNNIIEEELYQANTLRGLRKFLMFLKISGKEMHVISAGENDQVNRVLIKKKLSKYFLSINGSPAEKLTHMKNICKKHKVIYLGDSESDYKLTVNLKIPFIFISEKSNWQNYDSHLNGKKNVFIFKNFLR